MISLYYMHIWLVEGSMVTILQKANFSLLQRNKFYLIWWRLYGYCVLRKANFSLLQRNKFYLTIMVVVKH